LCKVDGCEISATIVNDKQAPSEGKNRGGTKHETMAIALLPVLALSGPVIYSRFLSSKDMFGNGSAMKESRERNGPDREGVAEGSTVDGSPVGPLLGMLDG
jgi:hypothetical protein